MMSAQGPFLRPRKSNDQSNKMERVSSDENILAIVKLTKGA